MLTMKNSNQGDLQPMNAAEMRETTGGLFPSWLLPVAVKIAQEIIKSLPKGPIY